MYGVGGGQEEWNGHTILLVHAFVGLIGCRGPSLAAVGVRTCVRGPHQLLWAIVGHCWPMLVVVGLCQPALAFVGLRWPNRHYNIIDY